MIAEFMGAELDITCAHYDECNVDPTKGSVNPGYRRYDAMEYHTSWDWLMPVVEKMWSITGHRNMFYQDVTEEITIFSDISENTKDQVYDLVVQFIEWYNENK